MTQIEMKAKTIDIGSIAAARELIFCSHGGSDHRLVLQAPGAVDDYLAFITRFPKHEAKRTSRYYIADTDGHWYACYNVDCFDPPFAIVRARSWETAYEVFCDEFSDWLKVDESDANDYAEDDRHYSSSGVHIDTDNVQIHEIQLLTVEL